MATTVEQELRVVGRRLPKLDAPAKVMGQTMYADASGCQG